jgi:hypothetical protein
MAKGNNISASDLFGFVFLNGDISEEKGNFISSTEKFRKKVDQYFSVKREIEKELPLSAVKKLALRVASYIPEETSGAVSYN